MDERFTRWRLVLGHGSEKLGELEEEDAARAGALAYLYDREGTGGRAGGSGSSALTVPDWLNQIHELFPRRVVRTIESDALDRYGMIELVTNKELLERVEPSEQLLQAVLKTKHLMSDDVLAAARQIVRRVVEQLVAKLKPRIKRTLTGRKDPFRRSFFKVAANFDPKRTVRANLKNYDAATGQLVISEPIFVSRTRRHSDKWQFVVLVDQSGSMADSLIHSAVTASIFHSLPALRTHLIAFDTAVVDLTSNIQDPVETLMKVQLGGGTDIAKAVRYAEQLLEVPRRSIVVIITDLFEGGNVAALRQTVRRLIGAGARVLILGALTTSGYESFDEKLGAQLASYGAFVGVMTPHELADWVAEVIA